MCFWTVWEEIGKEENYFDSAGNEFNSDGLMIQDLFADFEELPLNVQNIILEYAENEGSYESCAAMVESLNKIGYTCDYYLDAEPFNLRKI